MAAVAQKRIVHKQFNSPIGLYSDTNIKATLDRDLKMLSNGAVGIAFENSEDKPACLANSAVLRYLEEEEAAKAKANYNQYSQPQHRKCRSIGRDTVLKLNRGHRIRHDSSWPPKETHDSNDPDAYLSKLKHRHELVDTIKHDYFERANTISCHNNGTKQPRARSEDSAAKKAQSNINRALSEDKTIPIKLNETNFKRYQSIKNLNEIESISLQDLARRSTTPSTSELKPPMSPRSNRKLKKQSTEDDRHSENVTDEFVYINNKTNCLNLSKQILQEAEQHLNQFEQNLKQNVYDEVEREAICQNLYTLEHSIMELITKLNRINEVSCCNPVETLRHTTSDETRLQSSHDKFYQAARLFMAGHFDRGEGLKKVAWPPHQSSPARTLVQQQQQPHQPSPQYQQPPQPQQQADWWDASRFCTFYGMYLIDVRDAIEHENIRNAIGSVKNASKLSEDYLIWTSGVRFNDENRYYWETTGQPMIYTDWSPGEPHLGGAKCIVLHHSHKYQLADADCPSKCFFMCQRTAMHPYKDCIKPNFAESRNEQIIPFLH